METKLKHETGEHSGGSLCSEIIVTLKMEGKKRNCAKVRKQLADRICEALRYPEHYIGAGEVNYEWTVHIK